MSRVSKSVIVKGPPERIMEYIADVSNHPAFIGPLKSVTNLSGDPKKPGTTWDWTFVMAGVEFSGKAESVRYEPGKSYSYRTTSGIRSTFKYSCEAVNGGTRLDMEVSYDVPESLLAKTQTAFVEKLNDNEGTQVTQNLKAILDE